jgi:hypothetical protein
MKFLFISILLFSLSFKSCRNEAPAYIQPTGVEKDSATIAQEKQISKDSIESNKIVSSGTIDGYDFQGKSVRITTIDMMLDNGMEMLMSEGRFVEMKLLDDIKGITLAIRILDMQLLNRVPFSYTFTEGKKLIITVIIKNDQGVNELFGGTILNMKGRFTINGIDKQNQTLTGSLDAELTNILDLEHKCRIENVRFFNCGYYYSKENRTNDTALFKNKESLIVQ